jgi:hypothetical protein
MIVTNLNFGSSFLRFVRHVYVSVLINGTSAERVFELQMTKLAEGICVSCMEEHYASLSKCHNTGRYISSLPALPTNPSV